MSLPSGTIRTYTNGLLVDLIADLEGFSADPVDGEWWTTRPINGQPLARRLCVIGFATGTVEEDGIAAGHGPSVDDWLINCGLAITDEPDVAKAEQAVEDAFNQIADMLAADGRLGVADGPRNVRVTGAFEIGSGHEQGQPLVAWLDFNLAASADIRRNQ